METFLLFLSGFKKSVIDDCKMDKFFSTIIGALLLIIGIYATLAWSFFFQTIWTEWYIYFSAGLLMGSYIVCFDRSLIAAMAVQDKEQNTKLEKGKKFVSIVVRFLLAILLGIFLSQPMILKFYQSDIQREAEFIRTAENQKYQLELDSVYQFKLTPLQNELSQLHSEIKRKDLLVQNAEQNFINEMDTHGGTGKYGYGDVAKNKEKIRDDHKTEYNDLLKESNPKIEKLQSQIDSINNVKNIEFEKHREENTTSGTLIQARALKSLINKDETGTLKFRYRLLSIILTLIELSAFIAKLFFRFTSYQKKVALITETEINNSENNKDLSLETSNKMKEKLKNSFFEQTNQFFIKTRPVTESKLEEMIEEWKKEKDKPLREFCQSFMNKLLIRDVSPTVENNGQWNIDNNTKISIYSAVNSIFGNILVLVIMFSLMSMLFLKFAIPQNLQRDTYNTITLGIALLGLSIAVYEFFDKRKKKDNT